MLPASWWSPVSVAVAAESGLRSNVGLLGGDRPIVTNKELGALVRCGERIFVGATRRGSRIILRL